MREKEGAELKLTFNINVALQKSPFRTVYQGIRKVIRTNIFQNL
jgi:hypothetical protein